MRSIKPERLTRDAFKPFGTVIEAGAEDQPAIINSGTCRKYAELAMPDCAMAEGQAAIHIYRSRPLPHPIVIEYLERHVCGSQAFVPLSDRPFLVVVAPRGNTVPQDIRVFRAEGHQGVQYDRGTWHHFCLALEAESEFLVIDRFSPTPDCEEQRLSPDQRFTIEL